MTETYAPGRHTLHAWRTPTKLSVTRHRTYGSWLVTAYGSASREYLTWEEAMAAADAMAWAVRRMAHRRDLMLSRRGCP